MSITVQVTLVRRTCQSSTSDYYIVSLNYAYKRQCYWSFYMSVLSFEGRNFTGSSLNHSLTGSPTVSSHECELIRMITMYFAPITELIMFNTFRNFIYIFIINHLKLSSVRTVLWVCLFCFSVNTRCLKCIHCLPPFLEILTNPWGKCVEIIR